MLTLFRAQKPCAQKQTKLRSTRCFHQGSGLESGLALHAIEGPVAGRVFLVGSGGASCLQTGVKAFGCTEPQLLRGSKGLENKAF